MFGRESINSNLVTFEKLYFHQIGILTIEDILLGCNKNFA